MPSITARICGICPVSHLLASAKACDAIMSVRIPETAALLRELLHCAPVRAVARAELLPSLRARPAAGHSIPTPRAATSSACIEEHPDMARDGIALRKFGQEVIEGLAKERIHPSWIVPGGVNAPLAAGGARPHSGRPARRQGHRPCARWSSSRACSTSSTKRSPTSATPPRMYAGLVDDAGQLAAVRRPAAASRTPKATSWPTDIRAARLRPVHRRSLAATIPT